MRVRRGQTSKCQTMKAEQIRIQVEKQKQKKTHNVQGHDNTRVEQFRVDSAIKTGIKLKTGNGRIKTRKDEAFQKPLAHSTLGHSNISTFVLSGLCHTGLCW